MEIKELTKYSYVEYLQLEPLMHQLSEWSVFSEERLKAVIQDDNCHLFCIIDNGQIVGCATLCVFHTPTGTKASVEDVVVSNEYRGKHLGKQLMEHLLNQARAFSPIELHLTSNPKRIAANGLYQSIGFTKKETNAYWMEVK